MTEQKPTVLATFHLVLVAMLVALTVISANLRLTLGVIPITMQTLVVILSGVLLGRRGWQAPAVYLGMGLMGFPFFAAGGGIGYIFQPTFGFLLGFIPGAFLAGWLTERQWLPWDGANVLVGSIVGVAVIYAMGLSYIPLAGVFFGSPVAVLAQILPALPLMLAGEVLKVGVIATIAPVLRKELAVIRLTLGGGSVKAEETGR